LFRKIYTNQSYFQRLTLFFISTPSAQFKMRSTAIFTTLFTATVLASPYHNAEVVQVRQVERRQDYSSIDLSTLIPSGCLPPNLNVPTAPAAVLSAIAAVTNPCDIPSITGSAGSEYTSYTKALSSWYDHNSGKLESWASAYKTACPLAGTMSVPDLLPSNTALLSLASCGAGATSKSGGDATSKSGAAATSGTGTGSVPTAGAQATGTNAGAGSTGAAPQQTALAAAAGILAGIAGVVAVL